MQADAALLPSTVGAWVLSAFGTSVWVRALWEIEVAVRRVARRRLVSHISPPLMGAVRADVAGAPQMAGDAQ